MHSVCVPTCPGFKLGGTSAICRQRVSALTSFKIYSSGGTNLLSRQELKHLSKQKRLKNRRISASYSNHRPQIHCLATAQAPDPVFALLLCHSLTHSRHGITRALFYKLLAAPIAVGILDIGQTAMRLLHPLVQVCPHRIPSNYGVI